MVIRAAEAWWWLTTIRRQKVFSKSMGKISKVDYYICNMHDLQTRLNSFLSTCNHMANLNWNFFQECALCHSNHHKLTISDLKVTARAFLSFSGRSKGWRLTNVSHHCQKESWVFAFSKLTLLKRCLGNYGPPISVELQDLWSSEESFIFIGAHWPMFAGSFIPKKKVPELEQTLRHSNLSRCVEIYISLLMIACMG